MTREKKVGRERGRKQCSAFHNTDVLNCQQKCEDDVIKGSRKEEPGEYSEISAWGAGDEPFAEENLLNFRSSFLFICIMLSKFGIMAKVLIVRLYSKLYIIFVQVLRKTRFSAGKWDDSAIEIYNLFSMTQFTQIQSDYLLFFKLFLNFQVTCWRNNLMLCI